MRKHILEWLEGCKSQRGILRPGPCPLPEIRTTSAARVVEQEVTVAGEARVRVWRQIFRQALWLTSRSAAVRIYRHTVEVIVHFQRGEYNAFATSILLRGARQALVLPERDPGW